MLPTKEELESGKFILVSPSKRKRHWNGMIIQLPGLNPQVWGRTPSDILHHILTFLPLPALCRFKSVSKAWFSAIGDGTLDFRFKKQRWYLMRGFSCLGLLDGNAGFGWKAIDVPNLQLSSDDKIKMKRKLTYNIVIPYSACPGWVACLNEQSGKVAVFNPLVQSSWNQLPHPPQVTRWPENRGVRSVICFGIQAAVDDDRKASFTVVQLLGFSPRERVEFYELELQVYSSTAGEWTSSPVPTQVLGSAGEVICICEFYGDCMVLREDHLYFVTVRRNNTRSLKSIDVWNPSCSLKTIATWTTLPWHMNQLQYEYLVTESDFPGMEVLHPVLVHCQGRHVLVGMIPFEQEECSTFHHEDERLGTVGFLTLDEREVRRGWQLLARLPLEMLPRRVWNGVEMMHGSLYAATIEDEITVFMLNHKWGCIYNLTSQTWRSAFGDQYDGQEFFPFTPSLSKL